MNCGYTILLLTIHLECWLWGLKIGYNLLVFEHSENILFFMLKKSAYYVMSTDFVNIYCVLSLIHESLMNKNIILNIVNIFNIVWVTSLIIIIYYSEHA